MVKKLARKPIGKSTPPKQTELPGGYTPLSMVLYGPSGVGKTELAAAWPDVGFIHDPQEDGINDLVEYGRCKKPNFIQETEDFEQLIEFHKEIAISGTIGSNQPIKTLVNDALTGMERLCFAYHCREYFEDNWTDQGFYSFYKGPKNAAKRDWPRYIQSLIDVWKSGINIILIGHSKVGDSDNPSGTDYKTNMPYLDKEIWAQTHQWAKCIVYYGLDTETEKVGTKTKAKTADFDRNLYTEPSPHYVAKNRYGLSPVISAGSSGKEAYKNFMADLSNARKNKRAT